jgi:hypothetical protein
MVRGHVACFARWLNDTPSPGLNVVANRIFGPQPHVHTYVCIWEIKVGDVKASMSYGDVQAAVAAGKSFVFNFADAANAPAAELLPELAPDGQLPLSLLEYNLIHLQSPSSTSLWTACLPSGTPARLLSK